MNHSNCVISAVGRNSLHRMWLKGECNFDLHLVVYDDSMEEFRGDTEYICHIKGYKLKVIYRYLEMYPELKERYDYFFFPDDDIQMDTAAINALFEAMRRYRLQIAQPVLSMSYYTWRHTLQDRYCKLRYINFVEMMVSCFSREALNKVLFTFNENETGWGTETHWPVLIDASQRDMAVIDEVSVVHTRPIQSGQAIHNRPSITGNWLPTYENITCLPRCFTMIACLLKVCIAVTGILSENFVRRWGIGSGQNVYRLSRQARTGISDMCTSCSCWPV